MTGPTSLQIIYELSVASERLEVCFPASRDAQRQRLCIACLAQATVFRVPAPLLLQLAVLHKRECSVQVELLTYICLSPAILTLQRENAALRQHVLDLRRGARAAGLELNASATFLPIPVSHCLSSPEPMVC